MRRGSWRGQREPLTGLGGLKRVIELVLDVGFEFDEQLSALYCHASQGTTWHED